MGKQLFISDEAIQKYGYDYFYKMNADDFLSVSKNLELIDDGGYRELDDGLLLSINNLQNVTLQENESDSVFYEYSEIRERMILYHNSKYYNMKEVCQEANISYQVYRNWKNSNKPFSDLKVKQLLKAMISISNKIKEETYMKTLSYINANEELIEVGKTYCFGQLWDGSGDGEELLESKCIAVCDENNDDEVVVDFEIVENNDTVLNAVVKITHIS